MVSLFELISTFWQDIITNSGLSGSLFDNNGFVLSLSVLTLFVFFLLVVRFIVWFIKSLGGLNL